MAYEEHKNLNESFQKSHLNRTHYNQLIGADEMSFDKGSNPLDDPSQLSMGFFNIQSSHKKPPLNQSPSDID